MALKIGGRGYFCKIAPKIGARGGLGRPKKAEDLKEGFAFREWGGGRTSPFFFSRFRGFPVKPGKYAIPTY